MRFSIVGLPHFGKKITRDLKEFAPQHSFSFYDTYYSLWDKIRFALTLPFTDLVISINGVSGKSGSLDLVLAMKKKLLMSWQGTDALLALQGASTNSIFKKYILYSTHVTDAPWLQKELSAIGIESEILQFKWLQVPAQIPGRFNELSVYSYLGQGNEIFYGWEIVAGLAKKNPEILFYIAGTNGAGLEKIKNVIFLGWINAEKMMELQVKTSLFIRLTDHDGYSLSVMEALSYGSEVIWSQPHSHSHFVDKRGNAMEVFSNVVSVLRSRGLERNKENILFIKNNFSREKIMGDFVKKITSIANS